MTRRSQRRSTEFQPVPVTRIWGNSPTKDRRYRSSPLNSLHAFKMEQQFTPLRPPSMKSSTPSRTSRRESTRSQSNTTSHSPKRKNIVLTMTVRDTRPSTAEASGSTWKNLSAKASSNSTFLPRGQPPMRGSLRCRAAKRSASHPTVTRDHHPVQGD